MTPPLLIALQIANIPSQLDMALELVQLIRLIEPEKREDIHFGLWHTRDTPQAFIDAILKIAGDRFQTMTIKSRRFGKGWPIGCNDLWQDCMDRLFQLVRDGKVPYEAVLTFEPDCLPLRPDWLNVIKDDWQSAEANGKRVCGHVHGNPASHINGNLICASNLIELYPKLLGCHPEAGWDAHHGDLLLKIGMDSPHIFQLYRLNTIDKEELGAIRKHGQIPALFHGIKTHDGLKIINDMVLSGEFDQRSSDFVFTKEAQAYNSEPKGDGEFSILIRSYAGDFDWLPYCIRAIKKNITGWSEIVLVLPEEDRELWEHEYEIDVDEVIFVRKIHRIGYLDQQITKLNADKYCSHEFICHIDSDMIATEPLDLADMLHDGKPIIHEVPWVESKATIWRKPTDDFLGRRSKSDTMTCPQLVYHRSLYPLLRTFCRKFHGVTIERYLNRMAPEDKQGSSPPCFSEFNALGSLAKLYDTSKHEFRHTGLRGRTINQHWSHSRPTPELKAQFEEMLK